MFGSSGLDPSFCETKSLRATVAYIDDTTMRPGQIGWASSLADKLKATLTPGERVTVVQLSPADGTSHEIWSGCWPEFTPEKRRDIAAKTYFFSANPLDNIKKQQSFFLSDLGGALTQIYQKAASNSANTRIDSDSPPRKEIIEALASDGARFSQSPVTVRAIVYSDLAENSDIGSVFGKASPPPAGVGKRLGTFFRHSIFYFYGVGGSIQGDPGYLENSKNFWTEVLASMDSAIEGFGSDLNVPNQIPVAAHHYEVVLTRGSDILSGKASLLIDTDGNLVDSWIGVSRLTLVALSGTLQCNGSDGGGCRLAATTSEGLVTNSSSETIDLFGADGSTMKGTIGVPGALTFALTAKEDPDFPSQN
jgi:hypothetical protein